MYTCRYAPHKNYRVTKTLVPVKSSKEDLCLDSPSDSQDDIDYVPLVASQRHRMWIIRTETRSPHSCNLAFVVQENTMQTAKGEKQLMVLPSSNTYGPQKCPA